MSMGTCMAALLLSFFLLLLPVQSARSLFYSTRTVQVLLTRRCQFKTVLEGRRRKEKVEHRISTLCYALILVVPPCFLAPMYISACMRVVQTAEDLTSTNLPWLLQRPCYCVMLRFSFLLFAPSICFYFEPLFSLFPFFSLLFILTASLLIFSRSFTYFFFFVFIFDAFDPGCHGVSRCLGSRKWKWRQPYYPAILYSAVSLALHRQIYKCRSTSIDLFPSDYLSSWIFLHFFFVL